MGNQIDEDSNGSLSKKEVESWFKKKYENWAVTNASAMLSEIDRNEDENITQAEWLVFWEHVKASGYTEENILEEVGKIRAGQGWCNFDDGVDVGPSTRDVTNVSKHAL